MRHLRRAALLTLLLAEPVMHALALPHPEGLSSLIVQQLAANDV